MPRVSSRAAALAVPPFDSLNQQAAALRARGTDVVNLGQALPGFPPPQSAIAAARLALTQTDAHQYSADAGRRSLRQALCERLGQLGVNAQPEDVIITAGGNQAFMLAALTVLDAGDEVILPGPYFINHEMAVRAVGAAPVEAPVRETEGFRPRWIDIEPYVTTRTRAVVLCSPSNPTGAVVSPAELPRIVRELSARDIMLLSDETYLHFVFDGAHVSAASIDGWRRTVVLVGTFSKSFAMTGWRAGYFIADRAICNEALKVQDAMIICAPVISQMAIEAAVRQDWNYMASFDAELRARRAALVEGLAPIRCLRWQPAAGGFFAFVRVDDCANSEALAAAILDHAHVVTIPGSAFGRSGEGYLRLSYGAASVATLKTACIRLARFFEVS